MTQSLETLDSKINHRAFTPLGSMASSSIGSVYQPSVDEATAK